MNDSRHPTLFDLCARIYGPAILLAAAAGVSLEWAAAALGEALSADDAQSRLLRGSWGFVCLGVFATASVAAFMQTVKKFGARQVNLHPDPGRRARCLALLVSPPRGLPEEVAETGPITLALSRRDGSSDEIELPRKSLKDDCEKLEAHKTAGGRFWSWEQILRAVHWQMRSDVAGASRLETVYLIGSVGEKGTWKSLDSLEAFLKPYLLGAGVRVRKAPRPADFACFEDVSACLNAMARDMDDEGIRERDLVFDITGGLKPTSVAAAIFTLNKRAAFQYVETDPPYGVRTYDLVYLPPPASR